MIANKTGKISIEEIASLMNRDSSTISSLISRFSVKHMSSNQILELVETVRLKAIEIAELQV